MYCSNLSRFILDEFTAKLQNKIKTVLNEKEKKVKQLIFTIITLVN